jgi:hypothetical protein
MILLNYSIGTGLFLPFFSSPFSTLFYLDFDETAIHMYLLNSRTGIYAGPLPPRCSCVPFFHILSATGDLGSWT